MKNVKLQFHKVYKFTKESLWKLIFKNEQQKNHHPQLKRNKYKLVIEYQRVISWLSLKLFSKTAVRPNWYQNIDGLLKFINNAQIVSLFVLLLLLLNILFKIVAAG